MDGNNSNSTPDPMAGRKEISKLLTDCLDGKSDQCPSRVTAFVFRRMNQQMIEDGNTITPEHKEVLIDSFKNNDSMCTTLYKENPHVMLSEGKGMVYRAGKLFHTGVSKTRKEDEPKNK